MFSWEKYYGNLGKIITIINAFEEQLTFHQVSYKKLQSNQDIKLVR